MSAVMGEFIGGHARTAAERLEALARIKAMSAADFARRDQEIKNSKRKGKEQKKKDTDIGAAWIGAAWLREHAPRTSKKATQTEPDPLDASEENIVDIDDIDVDAIDIDGGARGYGYDSEDDDADDAGGGGETDTDEPADIDILISLRESRARADRWGHRPTLGFENGIPLGASTADICDQGPGRTKGKAEMTRADEAREFQRIRQSYPTDGFDYKVLCYLCDPTLSKVQIGDKLGRDPRAIRYAAGRIRKQAAAGKFRTRRGAGATGVNMDDRSEVGAWLAQPLPKARCGRKKKGATQTTPKRIRVPKRLKLAPREPQNVVIRAWGNKPRIRRPRIPDFASPQADFGVLFGEGWGIPPCAIDLTMARAA